MSVWPIAVPGLSREQLARQIEAIVERLPANALAQIRIAGEIHRDAFAGMRLRERVHTLRPDVIVQLSYRGIDFVAATERTAPASDSPPPVSPFAEVAGAGKRIHSATPTNLGALPVRRGVYAMYDGGGTLLYVGKAANLRSRTRAHVQDPRGTNFFNGWTTQIARVEAILVERDEEALEIESKLIRALRPPFNWIGT
ncbi:MAG TPA: nucleotide excision repair endonuclease [Phycisphaerae bacterium]|nr:nucleotide excision repair endonuclease [Phycisphaerae bacterium]